MERFEQVVYVRADKGIPDTFSGLDCVTGRGAEANLLRP